MKELAAAMCDGVTPLVAFIGIACLNAAVLVHVRLRQWRAYGGKGGDTPRAWKNVLLVISHPDDEAMFFGPTIQTIHSQGAQTHVLCLSNGDADGAGAVRAKELEKVARYLNIRSLTLLDDPRLKDGFGETWDEAVVASHVDDAVKRVDGVDAVLTFDARGVSRHPNHVATHAGVVAWMKTIRDVGGGARATRGRKPKAPAAWALVSVNVLRKFALAADAFASFFLEPHVLVVSSNPLAIVRAMSMHKSQWVWYRKLFVVFSRYTYTNTLKRM